MQRTVYCTYTDGHYVNEGEYKYFPSVVIANCYTYIEKPILKKIV